MISVLFENDSILKETSFGLDLHYQLELMLLKRKNNDFNLDVSFFKLDVLLIDLYNIIEKVKSIRLSNENSKIVLLIDSYSDHVCWIAKKIGLDGIFLKKLTSEMFYLKILSITETQNNICYKNYNPTIEFEKIESSLTDTEKRVLGYVGNGLCTKEISDLLNLSKRTIDNHRTRILNKLNCKNSSKLIYISTVYNLFKLL